MQKQGSGLHQTAGNARSVALRARIVEMARGYTLSQAIFTADEVGLFEALARGPVTLAALARRTGCSQRGMRALVDALAALELLEQDAGRVRLVAAAHPLLLRSGASYIGHLLRHQKHLYDRWGALARAVRSGRPVGQASSARERRERFLLAMVEGSRQSVTEVASLLDCSQRRSVLDLGGGLGAYAAAFALRWPHLDVTLFDLPAAVALARPFLRAQGLADRVACLGGDALRDPLGGPYDLIFLSNVAHIFSMREVTALLRRVRRALSRDGVVVVKDFVLRADRRGPLRAALFGLNMLVATESGGVLSEAEFDQVFQRAGLQRVSRQAIGEASLLLTARVKTGRAQPR